MDDLYDKEGNQITQAEFTKLRYGTPEYKLIARTTLSDNTWISTVWLGMNHQYGDGPPLIFETMVFTSEENLDEQDIERYATLEEAKKGHEVMITKWR